MFISKHLKYPLFLFLALFFAKIGYVVIESYYNYHVLLTTTNPELSREAIEELNLNGHRISSVGITFLLIPFFYLLVKRFSKVVMYSTILIFSVVSYIGVYHSLNIAVDKIVEANKDKRYDAYYVNIFKYGVLNNLFEYDSFIDNEKVVNDTIDVNDRILLTNTFLLLYADSELIEKLKERGKERIADYYIAYYKQDDYEKSFAVFKAAAEEIKTSFNKFEDAKKELKKELTAHNIKVDEQEIRAKHTEMMKELKVKYLEYVDAWDGFNIQYNEAIHFDKLENYREKLQKYFKYRSHEKAKRQYAQMMKENFGHYVQPEKWLNYEDEVTHKQIKKVIYEEMLITAKERSNGLPKGLDGKAFSFHPNVKIQVAEELKKSNILIPKDFDYTYQQFRKYYKIATSKGLSDAYRQFYSKLKQRIGDNDLKLSDDWSAFVNSNYIRKKIEEKIHQGNVDTVVRAIESTDLSNFKTMIYMPEVLKEVQKIMYSRDDFLDGEKAEQIGNDAIKLLYIPPFALFVSLVALLLNIITIIGMNFSLLGKTGTRIGTIVKSALFVLIIIMPSLVEHQGFDNNQLIQKVSNTDLDKYLQALNWMSYYEQINAGLH